MDCSAIVTGGTGGLGAAVVARLLDDGWRVVVPWVVERELERVQQRDGLELVQADLFDQKAVEHVVATAAAERERAAPRPGQPRRRLRGRRPRPRDPDRGLREAVPAQPPLDLSDDPGGGPHMIDAGSGVDRVRRHPRRPPALQGRRRLHRLQSGRHRLRRTRWRSSTRTTTSAATRSSPRNRHPRQPRRDAQVRLRPLGQAGRDSRRDRLSAFGRLVADERRRDSGLRKGIGRPSGRDGVGRPSGRQMRAKPGNPLWHGELCPVTPPRSHRAAKGVRTGGPRLSWVVSGTRAVS